MQRSGDYKYDHGSGWSSRAFLRILLPLVYSSLLAIASGSGLAASNGGIGADANLMNDQIRTLPPGKWGGSGIAVVVEKTKVSIEYPCAAGEIDGPIDLGRNGSFRVVGTHVVAAPGPLRKDPAPRQLEVVFEGRIHGSIMTLKVTRLGTKEVLGEFKLKKDASVRIKRCM